MKSNSLKQSDTEFKILKYILTFEWGGQDADLRPTQCFHGYVPVGYIYYLFCYVFTYMC